MRIEAIEVIALRLPLRSPWHTNAGTLNGREVLLVHLRSDIGDGWGEFMDWIAANGHIRAPDLWERYDIGPQSGLDASRWRTELTQPLKVG